MNIWVARETFTLPKPEPLLPEIFGDDCTTTVGHRPIVTMIATDDGRRALGASPGIEALLKMAGVPDAVREEVYAGGHRDDRGNITLDMGEGRFIHIERGGNAL